MEQIQISVRPWPDEQGLPVAMNPLGDMPFVDGADLQQFQQGRWEEVIDRMRSRREAIANPLDRARTGIALVEGLNQKDFKLGLQHREEKHHLIDEAVQTALELGDDLLLASALHNRGMALHIDFIMATGDEDAELDSFTRAVDLRLALGNQAAASFSMAMLGIFHHVDRLDRGTAVPILERAFELAGDSGAPLGRSEATRHLGQIKQELGDPLGALPFLRESLRVREESGWATLVPSALHAVASALLDAGDIDGARSVLADARARAESFGSSFTLAFIGLTEAHAEFAELAPGVWKRRHP